VFTTILGTEAVGFTGSIIGGMLIFAAVTSTLAPTENP
jgi:hypothetical protein